MILGNLITQVLRINQTLPIFMESQTILALSPRKSSGGVTAPLAGEAERMKLTLKALRWHPCRWQGILEMATGTLLMCEEAALSVQIGNCCSVHMIGTHHPKDRN